MKSSGISKKMVALTIYILLAICIVYTPSPNQVCAENVSKAQAVGSQEQSTSTDNLIVGPVQLTDNIADNDETVVQSQDEELRNGATVMIALLFNVVVSIAFVALIIKVLADTYLASNKKASRKKAFMSRIQELENHKKYRVQQAVKDEPSGNLAARETEIEIQAEHEMQMTLLVEYEDMLPQIKNISDESDYKKFVKAFQKSQLY